MTSPTLEQLIAFAEATGNELFDPEYFNGPDWMTEAVETQESIADFVTASNSYAESSREKFGSIAGFNFVAFSKIQVRKGAQRRVLSVIDFGTCRIAIDADLTNFAHREPI